MMQESATTPPIHEKVRKGVLAAALAVKSAGSIEDVAGTAANAAASAGLPPDQAASIGIAMEEAVRIAGQSEAAMEVHCREAAVSAALASAEQAAPPVAGGAGTAPPSETASLATPPLNVNRLYEVLREISERREWVPLSLIAERCGASEESVAVGVEGMRNEDFIRVENRHIFVTDSGQRFLEYRLLTKS